MKKILVIENKTLTRNIFLNKLKDRGFYAIGAKNGIVAIQKAQEELPDLIISEIDIPQIDGYNILTILRQQSSTLHIPFIFLTHNISKADIRKAMELGADDYLIKPCSLDTLLKAIAIRLERQNILKNFYTQKLKVLTDSSLDRNIKTKRLTQKSIFPSVPQISKVFEFIEANYNQSITLNDVAVEVGYTPTYLTHLVRTLTGQTVQKWIILRRMVAARSLLLETDLKVEDIAIQVGYNCTVHFFRQFRQHHGTTPHAWRNSHKHYENVYRANLK
ncbi:response regulator transcription factor [Mastigocoleus sp. MO_188.B34]|uniref:response regulator transcription factor n=1 Tax=Mastigocoleus sp. MO_188.B34 TaxID=3036635 RepID=UPI00261B6159|nr:response regulator transcription factor [Mastigocoleus sp. MO_188.B34]MDJ0697583.1 response regulator transcription factor [Mastigocoleus sp. MO_188.B34]